MTAPTDLTPGRYGGDQPASGRIDRGRGGRRRILVVDDEEDVRQLVARILQDAGFQVDVASDGGTAIAKLTSERPDLLILDLMMPEIDGWAVLAHASEMLPPPLVLVLSGGADYDVLERATREGASAIMSKPFRFHELLAKCHTLLTAGWKRPSPDGAPVRSSPRRVLMAEVTVLSDAAAPFYLGTLVNLSRGGAQLELEVSLEIGDRLRVACGEYGTEATLDLDGRVQWRSRVPRGFAYGLGFGQLEPEQERRLRKLLQETGSL